MIRIRSLDHLQVVRSNQLKDGRCEDAIHQLLPRVKWQNLLQTKHIRTLSLCFSSSTEAAVWKLHCLKITSMLCSLASHKTTTQPTTQNNNNNNYEQSKAVNSSPVLIDGFAGAAKKGRRLWERLKPGTHAPYPVRCSNNLLCYPLPTQLWSLPKFKVSKFQEVKGFLLTTDIITRLFKPPHTHTYPHI